jgi:hypothetical protein
MNSEKQTTQRNGASSRTLCSAEYLHINYNHSNDKLLCQVPCILSILESLMISLIAREIGLTEICF